MIRPQPSGTCRRAILGAGFLAMLALPGTALAGTGTAGPVSPEFGYLPTEQAQNQFYDDEIPEAPQSPGSVLFDPGSYVPGRILDFNYIDTGLAPGAQVQFFTASDDGSSYSYTVDSADGGHTGMPPAPCASSPCNSGAQEEVVPEDEDMVLPAQGLIGYTESGDVVPRDGEFDDANTFNDIPICGDQRPLYYITAGYTPLSPGSGLRDPSYQNCHGIFDFYADVDWATQLTGGFLVHGTNYDVYEVHFADADNNVIQDNVDGGDIDLLSAGRGAYNEYLNDCSGDQISNPIPIGNGEYAFCVTPGAGSDLTSVDALDLAANLSTQISIVPRVGSARGGATQIASAYGYAVRVPRSCTARGGCVITVRLTSIEVKKRNGVSVPEVVTLGGRRITLARGQKRVLDVGLDVAGQTLLEKQHRLVVSVSVKSASAGKTTARIQAVTLREQRTGARVG